MQQACSLSFLCTDLHGPLSNPSRQIWLVFLVHVQGHWVTVRLRTLSWTAQLVGFKPGFYPWSKSLSCAALCNDAGNKGWCSLWENVIGVEVVFWFFFFFEVGTSCKTKRSIMKVNLPFILCSYAEISDNSSWAPFEIAFVSFKENVEISFLLAPCCNPSLSKLCKQTHNKWNAMILTTGQPVISTWTLSCQMNCLSFLVVF